MTIILVAEDDSKQAYLIRAYLEREGYIVEVVENGHSALETALGFRYDLVILDIMMPGVDGLDVCRVLRNESQVPILMLTARNNERDLLLSLELGADDYITKPYSPRELTARVRALLRRSEMEPSESSVWQVGSLQLDSVKFKAWIADVALPLTAREFAILAVLIRQPERVFSRAEILELADGFATVSERTVDAHVVNLRRKLESEPTGRGLLQTVYGRGYALGLSAE